MKGKGTQKKKSARKLGTIGKSTVETTETNYEPGSKRVKKMPDGVNAEKVRVIDGYRNETEIPVLHSFMRSCTQHKLLDGKSKKSKSSGEMNSQIGTSMKSNIGGSTSHILLGRCQSNEAIHPASSVMDVSAKNNCAEGIEQVDCSVINNFGKLQACNVRNTFMKKCDDTVSKVCCGFCQSVDITEVCSDNVQMPFFKFQIPGLLNGKSLLS
jgi:BRCA1-associated RING domain protein 1